MNDFSPDLSIKKKVQKKWQDSTIRDNFVFSKTMEMNPELCRQLIGHILQTDIQEISYPEREKVIENRIDSKGVRLDVYVKDESERIFDLEMQVSEHSDELANRMRYYQGIIDGDNLKRGQFYKDLKQTYIIFICPFDPFKRERHIYTFRERCEEDPSLKLQENGAVKIFLSTKGKIDDVSRELRDFLNYVESGVINGSFVKKLDETVQSVKINEKARVEFMTYEMALLERELKGREDMRLELNQVISQKNQVIFHKDKEIARLKEQLALAQKANNPKKTSKSFSR